ncbi:MAG: DUF5689 domain-containing protein [Mucilaginibacter sp.]|uniref:DUF5689 domain-containing protein n=1 Tax=Mucilaginibacter sp. TaxID=1882438 RepID=UPI003264AFD5
MKKILLYTLTLIAVAATWSGCTKVSNYPGGTLGSIIAVTDIRTIYKGTDVTLNTDNMFGATKMVGMVVSDFSGGNMSAGLLVVQNNRRTRLRGISIALGADAASFVPGDSVNIDIAGGTLTRIKGILQITGLSKSNVTKISSGNVIAGTRATSAQILTTPDNYESTLVAVVKGSFNPQPSATSKYAGDYLINDGFGDITLHTEAAATFANTLVPGSGNFTGIVFGSVDPNGAIVPQIRMRTLTDVRVLASTPSVAPFIIAGFVADPISTDANYEYIQLLATRDINFATENFTVVTTNNATASTPLGFPVNGWATGGLRTYKLELTSGTVTKGQYFYVGGTGKKLMGGLSKDISSSNWIKAFPYNTTNSPNFSPSLNTFGVLTTNLIGNSGNASGIAAFVGTNIIATSVPFDVIFLQNGGNLYDAANKIGYNIANTDFYDTRDVISFVDQPFFKQGSNTLFFAYPTVATATVGYFAQLGGAYNVALGKWSTARALNNLALDNNSVITDIENATSTKLK